jgi:hypothetical protein
VDETFNIANGTVLLVLLSTITIPTVATITPCFGYRRIWCIQLYTWATLLIKYYVYFCFNKWYCWKCGLHYYKRYRKCSCWSNYWNGIGTNNCGYYWWSRWNVHC